MAFQYETRDPQTREMITIAVYSAAPDHWFGFIGGVTGQFAYGIQDDAPWIVVERSLDHGAIIREIDPASAAVPKYSLTQFWAERLGNTDGAPLTLEEIESAFAVSDDIRAEIYPNIPTLASSDLYVRFTTHSDDHQQTHIKKLAEYVIA